MTASSVGATVESVAQGAVSCKGKGPRAKFMFVIYKLCSYLV
jgi:hypothetical protein